MITNYNHYTSSELIKFARTETNELIIELAKRLEKFLDAPEDIRLALDDVEKSVRDAFDGEIPETIAEALDGTRDAANL